MNHSDSIMRALTLMIMTGLHYSRYLMAARAASGYPTSAASVTLGRHSDPLSRPHATDPHHGRPLESPGRSSVPLAGSAVQPPQRRPSPPPLVRTDHVPRTADPRADLRVHPPSGHPYYASTARQAITPPGHRAGSAGQPPPPPRPSPGPPQPHPYHHHPHQQQQQQQHQSQAAVPRVARLHHQPESSSRPKHHLSHTSSAALPPPPPASSSRGPPGAAASVAPPPPAHAHQPKVLRLPEQEEDQPLDLGAPAKRRATPDLVAEGQPSSKSMRPEETTASEELNRSDPSGPSPQKVRTL